DHRGHPAGPTALPDPRAADRRRPDRGAPAHHRTPRAQEVRAPSPGVGSMTAGELTGKVALVTGATRGLGRAIADALAEAGATVIVSSRKAEACEEVAREITEATGAKAHPLALHV